MKNIIISTIRKDTVALLYKDHTPKAFDGLNAPNNKVVTLSDGVFDEEYATKPLEKYNRTVFSTKNHRIISFENADVLYTDYSFDPVSLALSVDPAAKKYPSMSPYSAFGCNPIIFTDNSGATLEVAGKVPVAVTDLQSLVPKEYRPLITVGTDNKISFDVNKLPDNVRQYEGVKLVSDLITSKNNYQYTVGDAEKTVNRESGQKQIIEANMPHPSFQQAITNVSQTERSDYPKGDIANNLPEAGFQGAVRISEGDFSSYNGFSDSYVAAPRGNIVFHELKENFLRTEGGADKAGEDYAAAHQQAGSVGKTFAKQVGNSTTGATGNLTKKEGSSGTDNFKKTGE